MFSCDMMICDDNWFKQYFIRLANKRVIQVHVYILLQIRAFLMMILSMNDVFVGNVLTILCSILYFLRFSWVSNSTLP